MPRTKKIRPVSLTPEVWYSPAEILCIKERQELSESPPNIKYSRSAKKRLELGIDVIRRYIVEQGKKSKPYRLDLENVQCDLLNEYIEIVDEQTAINWVTLYGLPAGNNQRIDYIIESASTLKKLLELNTALTDALTGDHYEPLEELITEYPVIQQFNFTFLTRLMQTDKREILWWDSYNAHTKSKTGKGNTPLVYAKYLSQKASKGLPLTSSENALLKELDELKKELNAQTCTEVKDIQQVFYVHDSLGLYPEKSLSYIFPNQYWRNNKEESLLELARFYLSKSLNIMLRGIQPLIDWQYDELTKGWIVKERFAVLYPWQAIAIELARRIKKSPLRFDCCANHNCKKPLIGMRSDARVCTKVGCRKWAQRHLPKIRQ